MHSILHQVVIEAAPSKVFEALTTEEGLSNWWTKAAPNGNEERTFFFGKNCDHKVVMETISSVPGRELKWQCVGGSWEDKGEFVFTVFDHERGVCLDFAHHGWEVTDDFYKHCNTKWGFFLAVSLKRYLETGAGLPHPNEPTHKSIS